MFEESGDVCVFGGVCWFGCVPGGYVDVCKVPGGGLVEMNLDDLGFGVAGLVWGGVG